MRIFILTLAIILSIWALWIPLGRSIELKDPEIALDVQQLIVPDSSCNRNIVAIQPYMLTEDYASEGHFYEKLKAYFEAASKANYFHSNTVVLLPEYVGTWLVASGEKRSVLNIGHVTGAMKLMVLSNPGMFIQSYFKSQKEDDSFAAAIFRMKAKEMARIYAEVFKELASAYHVTISAGTIVLPGPFIENDKIKTNIDQPLYNASFIFTPDGKIENQIVRKSYPTTSELSFLTPYPIEKIPVFDLPIGKSVVLVCADSWYPESYSRIAELGPEVVLVNSFCAGNNTLSAHWHGYDGRDNPTDVDREDIGKLTEREAWIKYALPGRLKQTKVQIGATVFLRGHLWDLGSDGHPLFVKGDSLLTVEKSDRAGIWNLCFEK